MQAGLAAPLLLSLLFAVSGAAVLAWPSSGVAPHRAVRLPPAGTGGGAAVSAARPVADVGAILARPLFDMSRRPPSEGSGGAVSTSTPRLSGIVVIGAFRHAVFETPNGGKPVAVGIGGHAGPYTVRGISDGAVTVAETDGEKTLRPAPLSSDQESAANAAPPNSAPIVPRFLPTAFSNQTMPPGRHTPSPLDNLLARLRSRH